MSWKESLSADVSSDITPGISLTIASVRIPAAASPPVITPNPEDGDSDAASPNQPNNQVNIPGVFPRTDFTTIVDEVVVPSQEVTGTAFGGTGAAGDPGTDDQTDAVTTGDIPGLTEIHKIQSESPQGSPGGSPSSGSFGSTT